MDKCKLIQIIEKELEELKVLTEEVAASKNDTSLIIEIALSKARLLCQEMELLRELSANEKALFETGAPGENEEELIDEDEVSDENISDPELEIINPEDDLDLDNATEEDDDLEKDDEVDEFDDEEVNNKDDEETEIGADEELIEFGEHKDSEPTEEEETPLPTTGSNESKMEQPSEVRKIELDDDDDSETATPSPAPGIAERPVIREIPKPETPVAPKNVGGESLQKGPTLNDTMSETKSPETTLTSGPISSLRAAIGLNDRFLFIREIFSNNTEKYNMIIDQLDKLETQQQAVELLKANISLQKNETSLKFVDLLKRRFAK